MFVILWFLKFYSFFSFVYVNFTSISNHNVLITDNNRHPWSLVCLATNRFIATLQFARCARPKVVHATLRSPRRRNIKSTFPWSFEDFQETRISLLDLKQSSSFCDLHETSNVSNNEKYLEHQNNCNLIDFQLTLSCSLLRHSTFNSSDQSKVPSHQDASHWASKKSKSTRNFCFSHRKIEKNENLFEKSKAYSWFS